MPWKYEIDILKELKDKGYNTTRLRQERLLNEVDIQKIRNGQDISIKVLDKLCILLECQPCYIIRHVKECSEIDNTP